MTVVLSFSASSARPWASTIGSLSTYTTFASGAYRWATWWTLSAVGSPLPRSTNCRTGVLVTISRIARISAPRLSGAICREPGRSLMNLSPNARSTAKLSLPPSR